MKVSRRAGTKVIRDDLLPLLDARVAARMAAQSSPVLFGLPALPTSYVERPEALEALRKALLGSRPSVGVVAATAVHGLGGLGKTIMARAICEDVSVRTAFPDGILWATLGQRPDIARIQREWIRVLGGDITTVTSPGKRTICELARLIADKAILLILDDIWQGSDASAMEVAGSRCRVLMTTRFAAQVEGATLVPLEVMQPAEAESLLRTAAQGQVTDSALLGTMLTG